MAKKKTPAHKAHQTRQMKAALTREYGDDTALVVMAALRNNKRALDNERDWQGTRRVAAILANFARGTYSHITG